VPDQPETIPITLSWQEDVRPESISMALLWAALGGPLIGGLCITLVSLLVEGYTVSGGDLFAASFDDLFGTFLLGPLIVAAVSLIVVIPCTLLFGLPAALLVRKYALRRWPALAVCIGLALVAQIAAILVAWGGEAAPVMAPVALPFSLGAALVLWWRLSPSA
jgi:hypothetical protein